MAQHPSSKDDQEKINNDRRASHPAPTMVDMTRPAKPEQNQQAQTFVHRLALVLLAASIMSLPFLYFMATKSEAWQLTALIYINIPFVIASSIGLWLGQRGRISLSVNLMLGVMGLAVLAASVLIAGIGIIAGMGFPLLVIYVASRTLTGREAARIDIFGGFIGIASIVASLFSQSTQISIPAVSMAVPVMVMVIFVLAGITIVQQFPAYSLRAKLVIIMVGVALFSITMVAFAMNQVISREIQQQAGASLSALAKGKALEIGAMLNRHKNTLESLVLNEDLQKELRARNASSTSDPAYLARLDEQWMAAIDETDPLIQNALNNQTAEELRQYQVRFPEYVEIFLTNKYGGNLAATNRTSDYYQADEDWWQAAWNKGMGGLYIGEPQFDKSTGLYAIDMALPVYYENTSEIIGILRATVDVTSLQESLRAGTFGRTGSVDLVFPDKHFLHGDIDKQVLQLDSKSADQLASLQDSFGTFEYEGEPSLISKNLISASGRNDKDVIESLGWYVVTHQDSEEALQPAAILVRTVLLTALAVLLLASALAFYLGRLLTTPISQLTSAAVRVSEGDLTAQAHVTSQDEIGTLATTFNSMTAQLHNLVGSMEQRVAERTRDLELASEVGRTVSEKVADLQLLLTDAVELIRDRFDLYYTQIYLAEADGRTLKLRAGTGDVGRTLLQRGHHLQIGSGSLNGRAASSKQAVIVVDTAQNPGFLPNPLLPNTRSEMAVPLISGDRVVGVLDMQSERPGALSETELSAFEALAAQLAIAIQNATLFAEAQQSKIEVEAQARRLTRIGWQDFLDAVERSEQLGYVFDQEQILPLKSAELVEDESVLTVPIMVTGEQIGKLQIASGSDEVSADTMEIIRSTASLLANQIENLRLFDQAERYRVEAEESARRLTREGWESYLRTRHSLADGYVYDLNAVQPVSMSSNGRCPEFARPVVVRDEIIGELAVDHVDARDDESAQIVAAVAEQLSGHIENLRLLEEAEQRRIEIQQGEARLAEALTLAKLGHWEYDPARDLFIFNDHFYSILHTTAEQEGGYTMSSTEYAGRFVYPEDIPVVGAEIGKALATKERLFEAKLESRVIYREGGIGYITVSVNVERDEQGNITRFYGANQDITERKNAEIALRESEQRYQQILDAITDMVLVKGEKSRIVWANRSFRDYYGMSNEQLSDMIDAPAVEPDYTLQYIKDDAYVYETGNILSIPEEPVTRYDGTVFPFETVKAPIRDANGKVYLTVGVSRDITERKKAEEVIRLAHQRAQIILESVTLPMVITRMADNHLTFVNQPALEVTRFEYEDVINQPSPDFYYNPEERKKFIAELRAKGNVSNMLVQLRRKDGNPFWALLSARTFDYQNEPSILTTFADITERVEAQESVARHAAELQTVAEVSTTTATTLEPDRLLQDVVNLTKEQFGLYHAHIYLADELNNSLLLTSGAGEIGQILVAEGHTIPMDKEQSLVAHAARARKAVIVNDVRSEPDFLPNPLLPETRAEMAVPMIVGDKVLGVFDVQSNTSGFSEEDANIYITLASQVGVALQNARLFEQTQKALVEAEESQKLIRTVIDSTEDWIFIKDRQHRYQLVNQGYAKALHISHEQFIGKTDLELGFPEELVKGNPQKGIRGFWNDDRLVMDTGQPQHFPEDPATIDGEVRIFDTIKVPLRDASGSIWGVLAFSRDLTERKHAEQIIAQRANQLETVARVSATASTVLDPDKLLQAVVDLTKERFGLYHAHVYLLNDSWNTLLLASGAGEVGRRLVEEEHAISLDTEQSLVARAARSGDVIIVNDVRSEPGFLANPLLLETQAEMAVPMIVGDKVLGVFDVQSRNPEGFSNEDASIYTTLASQVAVALQNARLYVEQAATVTQLRELDRLKSSFLANMSHELRTPLNSILGFADVILEELDGPLTENMDNDLRLIQKNGQHLLHLINDVLDMAKIEAGRMNLAPEKFRIYEILDEVTSITSTLASEKNLSLFIDESSDRKVEVFADHTRLRQVMINLVNNAIKFTEKGKISLKVEPMEGARVLISVKDSGIGIPSDKLEAVFQEFTQVDTSSTRKAGGTGLGLPISRRLVEMHGGRLWVESTGVNGEGSVFYVELPIEARITEVIEKTTK